MNVELSAHAPAFRYRTTAETPPSEAAPVPDWRITATTALSILREAERQSPPPWATVAIRTAVEALQAALWVTA